MSAPRTDAGEALEPQPDEIRWAQRRAVDALWLHGMDSPEYAKARDKVNRLLEPGKDMDGQPKEEE